MRTLVHLILFVCSIVIAVGSFLPLMKGVDPPDVALTDLRSGFPAGWVITQIGEGSVTFYKSLAIVLLAAAVLILLGGLFGSRAAGWLGVLVGLAGVGTFFFRINERFADMLHSEWSTLVTNQIGFQLVAGGLLVAILSLLVPRARVRTTSV